MLGQVVQVPDNKNNLDGMIFGSDMNIYYFTEFDHQGIFDILLGSEVEYSLSSPKSNEAQANPELGAKPKKKLFRTYVTIESCKNHTLNCVRGHVYITTTRTPDNVSIYESIRNYEVCGESISREQALEEMIQTARTCGANAVLGVNLQLEFNPVKKFLMYRYCGTLAQISSIPKNEAVNTTQEEAHSTTSTDQDDSKTADTTSTNTPTLGANLNSQPKTQASPGKDNTLESSSSPYHGEKTASRPMQIEKNLIHKSSPNACMQLRLQIFLLGFLLLFVPLCGQLILNYSHVVPRMVSFFFGLVTCIMTFVIYINLNPHKNCGYVRKLKQS